MAKERLSILGSTGSIGVNTLKICENLKDRFSIKYISGYSNGSLLIEQAMEYRPEYAVISEKNYKKVKDALSGTGVKVLSGKEGLIQACEDGEIDTVVNAIVGSFGLEPTVAAVSKGKKLCLANKESLVMAGTYITEMAEKTGSDIIPIDSEHSAMLQALNGENLRGIEKIILTASGGPFLNREDSLENVTPSEALKHPNWEMGSKITIDSATLMNKGFELIEAVHLFNISSERIEVIIHPESIIHSCVQFSDGSVIAQMGMPDMMLPIQYALTFPERMELNLPRLDLADIGKLNFQAPDEERFPALKLARYAADEKGTMPVVLNTVNEIMVYKFLDGEVKFTDIIKKVGYEMEKHQKITDPAIEEILELNNKLWNDLK